MLRKIFPLLRQNLLFLAAIGILFTVPAAVAEDTHAVSGRVIAVDPVGSTMVISYFDNASNTFLNMTILVQDDVVIMGGAEPINLNDVQVSDKVEVEFTGNPMGNPVARHITDMDRANE